jgi:hypothetical protein
LHVLDMVRGIGHEHRALAQVAAPNADLLLGPEGGGQQPEGVQLLDPLAVQDVGLAAGHVLELSWVDELDREASLTEQLEKRDPVHAGGLHGHGFDPAPGEPVGQGGQIRGEGTELTDVAPLGVATFRAGDIVAAGADVDASGIQVDLAELQGEPGSPATVRIWAGSRRSSSPAVIVHDMPGAEGR